MYGRTTQWKIIWKMGNGWIRMEELQQSGRNGQWFWKGFARIRYVLFTFLLLLLLLIFFTWNNFFLIYRFESNGTDLYFCWNQSWLAGLCLGMFQADISIGHIVCQSWWWCHCSWGQWNRGKFIVFSSSSMC